jgi:hypothetical protein
MHPASRFSDCLDGWEQQGNKDPDDRDHHQQLDERKAAARQALASDWNPDWPSADQARNPRGAANIRERCAEVTM